MLGDAPCNCLFRRVEFFQGGVERHDVAPPLNPSEILLGFNNNASQASDQE
jgi:hypothetical protein